MSSNAALAQSWVEFLSPYPWDWFGSFTFRNSPHPENADKCWSLWCNELNRHLFGKRWAEKGTGCYWVRATEYQHRGAIHFHALISGRGANLNDQARRLSWMDRWNEIAGFAKIEQPNTGAVVNYVSKYVAKGGEIEVSSTLKHFVLYQGARLLEVKPVPVRC